MKAELTGTPPSWKRRYGSGDEIGTTTLSEPSDRIITLLKMILPLLAMLPDRGVFSRIVLSSRRSTSRTSRREPR
jgi:hypothetical protein